MSIFECFISKNVIGIISQGDPVPAPVPVESPGRRCSTRQVSLPPSLPPSAYRPLIQAPQPECPPDSEATPEGAVRSPSGSAGQKEQSLLQVGSRTEQQFFFLLRFVFVFLNSISNTKFNENKFSIQFRRQRICESSTAFVIIVSFSGEQRSQA